MLRNAKQFAAFAFHASAEGDRASVVDDRLWTEFRNSGLAMSPFPKEFGGAGLCEVENHRDLCTLLRLIGAADLSLARLFEGHVNAVSLVERYGERDQTRDLSTCVARGGLSAVWGADDANGLQVNENSMSVLQGKKILASGAGIVTNPIVTAQTDRGKIMFLLHLAKQEKIDLSDWNPLGMRSTATGTVELSGIPVSAANAIGGPGDFTRQPHFSGGAWRFCAAHLGAIERLVDLFRDHLVQRGRGSDPYQLQRMANCVASAKTARYWVDEAARRLSAEGSDPGEIVAFANLTRMVTERSALDVMEMVQRGAGLASFLRPHPIERISRDLATYLRQPVPDLAMSDGAKTFLASNLSVGDF